jgi:N-acetylglucosaminyldiphosphoundecaprenol N-acetyl-beta-D-mannosaminyltransferase
MENINIVKINIFGLNVSITDYDLLLNKIGTSIEKNQKLSIAYANANILNISYQNPELKQILNSFDIVHPDGTGVLIASKLLYGKNGLRKKITGSDFYPLLIMEAVKNKWNIFFFGHDKKTLEKVKIHNPDLQITGTVNGFNFNTDELINKINLAGVQILIVGLGFPKQEKWIYENKNKLNCNVIIAVGDGIKVFSNTKIRGPVILRRMGFEWLIRLIFNPAKYWKRYLIGNPLFTLRIIKSKLSKFGK